MVDPNPARGMPHELERYWLHGKGAAKIRWGIPGDFKRCVRNLRKYFPTNPEGLCNILHTKATGGPPGHGIGEHALEAEALLAAAPMLGNKIWAAPLAPIGTPTGDGRRFAEGALSFRALPLPLEWVKERRGGHDGAVTVGRILGVSVGPDDAGQTYAWGWGDFFDPAVIPEVAQALALVEGGVAGISLDPGGFVEVLGERGNATFARYRVGGATLVSIPAFEGQFVLTGDDEDIFENEPDMIKLVVDQYCGCGEPGEAAEELGPVAAELAVNTAGWRGLPVADRESPVDRDDAIKRIDAWAQGDTAKLNRAFLWRHAQGDPASVYSYRLPVGDIINGKLTLIYHAIYAASALLEGGHGGLPNIPASEKDSLRRVISAIYKKLAVDFDDDTIKASWDRETKRDNGVTPVEKAADDEGDFAVEGDSVLTELTEEILGEERFAVRSGGWSSLPIADAGRSWDEGVARAALDSWAGDDIDKYARGFLWRGGDNKTDMKFPIAMPIDGKLTIVPRAVSAALGRLNQASVPAGDKARMRSILEGIRSRMGGGEEMSAEGLELASLIASSAPLAPPAAWFTPVIRDSPPPLDSEGMLPPLSIDADGHVSGYLALWKTCHRSVGRGRCVRAPRSKQNYRQFHLGSVLTEEGSTLRVGKVTMGAGHADTSYGIIPAIEHYDNAATAVAGVRVHEDQFGIQVNGAIVPGTSPEDVYRLRLSPLSGDWRADGGNLELVAALAVNTPAFPVFAVEEDEDYALVAAGQGGDMCDHEVTNPEETMAAEIDVDELAKSVASLLAGMADNARRTDELARQQAAAVAREQAQRAARLKELAGGK